MSDSFLVFFIVLYEYLNIMFTPGKLINIFSLTE